MVDQKLFRNSKPKKLLQQLNSDAFFSPLFSFFLSYSFFLYLSFLLFFSSVSLNFSIFLFFSLFFVFLSFLSPSSLIFHRFLACNSHLLFFLSFSNLFFFLSFFSLVFAFSHLFLHFLIYLSLLCPFLYFLSYFP